MKRVTSLLLLLCFLIGSLGVTSLAADLEEYDTYTLSGTFSGAKEGDLISVFVLKEGYKMEDIGSSSGSVMDKVYYTNIFETDANGAYSFDIIVPKGTSRSSWCVLSCNGIVEEDTLRSFLVSSGSLQVIYASPDGAKSSSDSYGTKEKPYEVTYAGKRALTLAKTSDVDILMLGGTYSLENSRIQFTTSESYAGTGHRITFAAASKDDKPVVTSMKKVEHQYITKLTEGDVYNRIPEKSRGMIYKLDMKAAGFAYDVPIISGGVETGKYTVLDMNYSGQDAERRTIDPPIIYLNGKRQMMSRYPNVGSVAFDNVKDITGMNENRNPTLSYSKFIDKMDFGKWEDAIDDAFLGGYVFTSYQASAVKITDIDTVNKKITIDGTIAADGKKGAFYYPNESGLVRFGPRLTIVNLPEEMDIPGEYYFNQTDKCIYYYAPYELTADDVIEMANDRRNSAGTSGYKNLVQITSAENITFDGIEFYGSRYSYAIYVSGSTGIEFRNCTVHATALEGMSLSGNNIVVENCDIYDTGSAGITIGSSIDVTKDSNRGNNIVRNNHIYNYSQNASTGYDSTGIVLGKQRSSSSTEKSIGDTAENNLIHASKFAGGIRYQGSGLTVRRNEVYNLLDSTDDIGAVYIGRSFTDFGNNLTENYIHDYYTIANPRYKTMGIYWDDYVSGQIGTRNIVVAPNNQIRDLFGIRTIGYDNHIENNTFVNINSGIGLSGRAPDKWAKHNTDYKLYNSLAGSLQYPAYANYSEKMQAMKDAIDDNDGQMVHMAKAVNNLTVNCVDGVNTSDDSDGRTYEYGTDNVYGNEEITDVDPKSIFVDPANQDYRVKASAITDGALSEVPNELNFDMDWIGIQTESLDADQSFKLMHPTNNESITKDSVILTWEQALFADKYEYVIATDSAFLNIVESGETKETFAIPTTTFTEGTTYYWKVKAVNFSRDMGGEWMCDKVETFTVGKAVDFEILENTVLSADGTTILRSLEGVKEFDFKYTVKNNSASSQEFIVIASLFSDTGKFQYAQVSESATVASGLTATGTFEFTPSFTMKDGYYVKLFVVDKPKTIKPLGFPSNALKKQ